MRRREFITLFSGAAATWPLSVRARQPGQVWRIGFLAGGSRPISSDFNPYGGFLRGMRELGYNEGKDFIMEWRFAEGRFELFPDLATEVVRLNVDAIVLGTPEAIPAVQRATNTIPIVMGTSTDPVGMGYVASLARPGGNTTGLASSQDDITPKKVELLSTLIPDLTRIGFLFNPKSAQHAAVLKIAHDAAQNAKLALVRVDLGHQQDIDKAFAVAARSALARSCPRVTPCSLRFGIGLRKWRSRLDCRPCSRNANMSRQVR